MSSAPDPTAVAGTATLASRAPAPARADRLPTWAAPAFACALVALWVAIAAVTNPAQFADSIEQYNWAHSPQWGYWKHPPLPTWLMAAAIAMVGPVHAAAYLLAALCGMGTAWFTWRLALMLLPAPTAMLAITLWPLHHGFSWRAQVYNHNTVLLLAVSAMTWAGVRAARGGRTAHWALAGALAGLALLAKYQALVPIAALVLALAWTGRLRTRAARCGLAVATAAAFAVFLPHLAWALARDVPTAGYLARPGSMLGDGERLRSLAGFLANQVGLHATMIVVALALVAGRALRRAPATPGRDAAVDARWFGALVLAPLAAVCVLVLAFGLAPQKYWGLQTLQFLPLWLAWVLNRSGAAIRPRAALLAAGLAGLAGAGWSAWSSGQPARMANLHSPDRAWPARSVAEAVMKDWRAATACPLRLVSGPPFPAGLVSVYSGAWPQVLEDGDLRKSPWVADLDRRAAGEVVMQGPMARAQVPAAQSWHPVPGGRNTPAQVVTWRIVPPARDCGLGP